jgi:hypothetical protein
MKLATRPAIAGATALLGALALVGCTSDSSHHASSSSASSSSSHSAVQPLPSSVKQDTKVPTKVPNKPASRKNVTMETCAGTGDGWKAAGTVRNPGSSSATYTITVFFSTTSATVLAHGDTKVKVAPGKSAAWSVSPKFSAPKKVLCVLRGVG